MPPLPPQKPEKPKKLRPSYLYQTFNRGGVQLVYLAPYKRGPNVAVLFAKNADPQRIETVTRCLKTVFQVNAHQKCESLDLGKHFECGPAVSFLVRPMNKIKRTKALLALRDLNVIEPHDVERPFKAMGLKIGKDYTIVFGEEAKAAHAQRMASYGLTSP